MLHAVVKKQPVSVILSVIVLRKSNILSEMKKARLCFKDSTLLNKACISDAMSVKPLPFVLNIKKNSDSFFSDTDVSERPWEDDHFEDNSL